MADGHQHTFKTVFSPERLRTILTKICRNPFTLTIEAHDRLCVPPYRIVSVTFATVEDRDRLRIALRQLEKEDYAKSRGTITASTHAHA